jgi:hypothetical protein
MLKFCVTLTLTVFLFLGSFESAVFAATKNSKKGKSKSSKTFSASKKNYKKNKNSKLARLKKNRGKKQRYVQRKRSGTGPDLRALTTESAYTDEDNGVNAIETNPGL